MSTKEIVLAGSKWVVGNGAKIEIWKDAWLPGSHNGKVLSDPQLLHSTATVSELILHDQHLWNTSLIDAIFHPTEAQQIKLIPIPAYSTSDVLSWRYTQQGNFTVRSTYQHLINVDIPPGSSSSEEDLNWNAIWKLKVPTKIKHFMHRLISCVLPTKYNLSKKNIETNVGCVLCASNVLETDIHLFFNCSFAQVIWETIQVFLPYSPQASRFVDIWKIIQESFDPDKRARVVMVLWAIWRERNQRSFANKYQPLQQVLELAEIMLAQWKSQQTASPSRPESLVQHVWKPPGRGMLKMNIDSGWAGDTGTGFGLVIRDELGKFMVAATKYTPTRLNSLTAEALSLRWAIEQAIMWDIDHLTIHTDCLQVVKALDDPSAYPRILNIIRDCLQLSSQFSFHIEFDYRSTNKVAHSLAAVANIYLDHVWWTEAPPCIALSVASEASNIC